MRADDQWMSLANYVAAAGGLTLGYLTQLSSIGQTLAKAATPTLSDSNLLPELDFPQL